MHANYVNLLHSEKDLQMAAGIVLIYPKTDKVNNNDITNDINVKHIIKNCNVNNINNSIEIQNSENNTVSLDQLSVAIGLIFHQQLNYTEIQIQGLIVANITSVNIPIFLVSMHPTKLHTLRLSLSGSTFVNNNSLYQLTSCLLNTT